MIKAMQDPRLAAAEQSKRQQQVQTKQRNCSKCRMPFAGFVSALKRISSGYAQGARANNGGDSANRFNRGQKRKLNLVLDEAARSAAIAPIVILLMAKMI